MTIAVLAETPKAERIGVYVFWTKEFFCFLDQEKRVLVYYLGAHFQSVEKPKGGLLENKKGDPWSNRISKGPPLVFWTPIFRTVIYFWDG